jgi:hypothetical protein
MTGCDAPAAAMTGRDAPAAAMGLKNEQWVKGGAT